MRDRAQGLLANVHGSVQSEVMSGQRQHGVAAPWWRKWQPGGPGGGAMEFCLVRRGEYLRESTRMGLEGRIGPGGGGGRAFQQEETVGPKAQKQDLAQGLREEVECVS